MSFIVAPAQPRGHRRRVLVTDGTEGQARSTVAAVRALTLGGFEPIITTSGRHSLAGASRYCAGRVAVPSVTRDPRGYAAAIRRLLGCAALLGALPASDAAMVALRAPGYELIDKATLAERAEAGGLQVPRTRVVTHPAELIEAARSTGFPLVVKPSISRIPAARFDDVGSLMSRLRSYEGVGPLLVQPYVHEELRSVAGVVWQGTLTHVVHQRYVRTWPVDCGPSCAAQTIAPDDATERGLRRLLGSYEGLFHAQFTGRYLLDLNLRVYGSMPLALASGVNLPSTLCELVLGRQVPDRRAREGVRYRWLEGDVRALAEMWRRGQVPAPQALRALRPRRGTAHSVASLRDPGPTMARLAYVADRRRAGPRASR